MCRENKGLSNYPWPKVVGSSSAGSGLVHHWTSEATLAPVSPTSWQRSTSPAGNHSENPTSTTSAPTGRLRSTLSGRTTTSITYTEHPRGKRPMEGSSPSTRLDPTCATRRQSAPSTRFGKHPRRSGRTFPAISLQYQFFPNTFVSFDARHIELWQIHPVDEMSLRGDPHRLPPPAVCRTRSIEGAGIMAPWICETVRTARTSGSRPDRTGFANRAARRGRHRPQRARTPALTSRLPIGARLGSGRGRKLIDARLWRSLVEAIECREFSKKLLSMTGAGRERAPRRSSISSPGRSARSASPALPSSSVPRRIPTRSRSHRASGALGRLLASRHRRPTTSRGSLAPHTGAVVIPPGRLPYGKLCGMQPGVSLGQRKCDPLVLPDGPPEHDALLGVADCPAQGDSPYPRGLPRR